MNKKSILYVILDLIFLAVFNTVFFVVGGTEHPASVWISYGFIHFSYIMILLTPFLIRKSSSAAIFGFSLYSISSVYFLIEFIVGLIFVLVRSDSYKAALVVQIIIAGIYAVLLLSNMIANEHTADSVARHENEVAFIKTASSRVKLLLGKTNDKKANKEIEKAYALLHSSPSKSTAEAKPFESQICELIRLMEEAVKNNSTDEVINCSKKITEITLKRNEIVNK